MRLKKAQREILLQWVAEGLQSDEINQRAAEYNPPFCVDRQQVDFYRKTRAADLKEITQAAENRALTTGLAIKANRVEKLRQLAEKLEADLFGDSLWVTDVKGVNGEIVYITRFNAQEVSEYREILEQIASEVGDRKADALPITEVRVTFVKPEERQA